MTSQILDIPVDKLLPNPDQPRTTFDPRKLALLAASIRQQGVIEPLVAEPAPDGFYILHAGERRLRASKIACLTAVPVVVVEPSGGDSPDRFLRAIAENIHREDLSPIEEAHAYQRLQTQYGWPVGEIAQRMGTYYQRVADRLSLLDYEPEIQAMIDQGRFSRNADVNRAMLAIPDSAARVKLAEQLAARGASNDTIKSAARRMANHLSAKPAPIPEGEAPAVVLAQRKAGPIQRPAWDAMRQLGYLPPWPSVVLAARSTCKACALAPHASESTCKECPSVALLRTLIQSARQGANSTPIHPLPLKKSAKPNGSARSRLPQGESHAAD